MTAESRSSHQSTINKPIINHHINTPSTPNANPPTTADPSKCHATPVRTPPHHITTTTSTRKRASSAKGRGTTTGMTRTQHPQLPLRAVERGAVRPGTGMTTTGRQRGRPRGRPRGKPKKGPRDVVDVSWAVGKFFFRSHFIFCY